MRNQTELVPEMLVNQHCGCGENPLWDDARGVLYWCDIPAGKVFEWDAVSGDHHLLFQGPEMGAFTLQQDGSLLLLYSPVAPDISNPESGEFIVLKEGIVGNTGRFNDCIATPRGDVYAGTVDWEQKDARRSVSSRFAGQRDFDLQRFGLFQRSGLDALTATVCIGPIRPPKRFICSITTAKAARLPTGANG